MWQYITDELAIKDLMAMTHEFHDSCLKEMKYTSGAYIDQSYSMYPTNAKRTLSIIFQRQALQNTIIEMEFSKIKYLKLMPLDERYTCEILDSSLFLCNGNIYWCDCGGLTASDIDTYVGTIVCAEKLRWRSIAAPLGKQDYFRKEI